jgi:hypothetical protein
MSGQEQERPPVLPVSALGVLTIVAYGACYYAYGVLIQPIGADTHWPDAALGAIFSAILVITGVLGILAGRMLDRRGPRPLFLLAAVAGTAAMLAASAQSALLPFAIAYAGGCGLVGALGFYHVTQAGREEAAPGSPRPGSVRIVTRSARSATGRGRCRWPGGSPIRPALRASLPNRPARRGSCGTPIRDFPGPTGGPGAWMFRRVAGRPVLPRMDRAAQRRSTMSRCQRTIVSGVISSRSRWRLALGITLSRAASRARSAQFSFGRRGCRRCNMASWWRRIKISAVFHLSSRRDSRSHAATRVIRRKTNRRHMIGDHHSRAAGRATLLVRAVDGIVE